MEDTLCIAAFIQCSLRLLYRLRVNNQRWRLYSPILLSENRWRAMRYSTDKGLIDLGRGRIMPFAQLMEELLELVREDAEALGCTKEVEHVRHILAHGTSAHHQLEAHAKAVADGATDEEALRAVVDYLIAETAVDTAPG